MANGTMEQLCEHDADQGQGLWAECAWYGHICHAVPWAAKPDVNRLQHVKLLPHSKYLYLALFGVNYS